jgi:4-amino-4-deoxy-L-arabinose transferase-like glycosyltransferase
MARPLGTTAASPRSHAASEVPARAWWQTRHVELTAVAVTLVLAATLRMAFLPGHGLFFWDEAKFALEGVRLHAELSHLLTGRGALAAGKAVGTAKPGHALLIALAYGLLGVHDYAALSVGAVGGVIEVLLVYIVGRRLFSRGTGLVAAALLAVATYDIVYARSALSETDANAIFLAGILLWSYAWSGAERGARPMRPALLFAAAVVCGFAFTVNYRMAVYIAVIVLIDLAWSTVTQPLSLLTRLPAWLAGLAIAPAAWQVLGDVAAAQGVALFRSEVTLRPQTYVDQVLGRFGLASSGPTSVSTLPVQWLVQREGVAVIAMVLAAVIAALVVRSLSWSVVAALVVLPVLASMGAPYAVARTLEGAIPFGALLIGALTCQAAGLWKVMRPIVALAVVLAVVVGTMQAWPIVTARSGFLLAARYVLRHHARGALTSSEIMPFYFRGPGSRCRAPRMTDLDHLAADTRIYRYAVLDYHAGGVTGRIVRNDGRLVARYPVLTGTEMGASLITSEAPTPVASGAAAYVEVYRIDTIHIEAANQAPADACLLGRPGRG